MSLSGFSLKHPIMIFMISILIVIFGIIGLSRLSLSLMPPIVKPGLTIITEYPGISPLNIENIITIPIEEIVSTVENIENIISSSEEGKSRINIQFKLGTDMDIAPLKVREKIYLIRSNFPRTVHEPLVIRYDPSNKPIVILSLSGGNISEMRTYSENILKRKFESIKGVSEVQISGGLQREIWVNVDRDKLYSHYFQIEDIISEVNGDNFNLPGGKINILGMDISVQTRGRYSSLNDIKQTKVKRIIESQKDKIKTNSILDVSEVINHYRDRDSIYRENNNEKVSIYIQKAGDGNTIKIAELVLEQIKNITDFRIEVSYNQAKYIEKSLTRVRYAGLIGGIIAMVILLIFLKEFKNTIAIGLSIPLSLLLTFFLMFVFNIGLNVMSMSGLALGIGMLIDNSIVVLENIHKNNAKTEIEVEKSVNEVFTAILASTLTTVAVFIPIVFASIEVKNLYSSFALSVAFSIFSSLFLSVTLIPVLYIFLHKKKKPGLYTGFSDKIRQFALIDKLLKIITLTKIKRFYMKFLLKTIKSKKRVLIFLTVLIITTVLVFPSLKKEYIDPFDTGEIICMVELPSGTNLFATDKIVKKVEEILKTKNYILQVSTKVEKWHATLYIKFVQSDLRNLDQEEIMTDLKKTFNNYKEAFVHFSESTTEIDSKEIEIQVIGDDLEKLKNYANLFAQKIKPLQGVRDVVLNFKQGRPEIVIKVNKDKAFLSGLSVLQIAQNIRNAIFGPVATKYLERGREIDLRVRFMQEFRSDPKDLKNILIRNSNGDLVRLEEIADFIRETSETRIFRKNQKRFLGITVKFGRVDMGEGMQRIINELRNINLPDDYRYDFGDNFEKMKKNQREMILSVILSFILIYMILASQFESFKYPFIIIFSIPFAIIGVILFLFILQKSLNVSVYIGLIMLAGIVVNNAIVLIDSFIQRKEHNLNLILTVFYVCKQRLKPILMTTLTTVFGLLPLLTETGEGSNLWKPMGLTVIIGLIFSTILTLIIIPLLYILITGKKR